MLLPPPFRKTGRETVNAAYIKKALATSLAIFKPKRSGFVIAGLLSLLFLVHTVASVQELKWW